MNLSVKDSPIVEVKHLQSVKDIERAVTQVVQNDIKRQVLSWDGSSIRVLRDKETEQEYRFIPEWDLKREYIVDPELYKEVILESDVVDSVAKTFPQSSRV